MENFENNKEKKDRQLDHLINLVENYTRTKRHLEQYSHIGNPENKENAREKQEVREEQIQELKEEIKGGNETKYEQLENLKQNYVSTDGYINNNAENMNSEMLNNIENKQENRRIQAGRRKPVCYLRNSCRELMRITGKTV